MWEAGTPQVVDVQLRGVRAQVAVLVQFARHEAGRALFHDEQRDAPAALGLQVGAPDFMPATSQPAPGSVTAMATIFSLLMMPGGTCLLFVRAPTADARGGDVRVHQHGGRHAAVAAAPEFLGPEHRGDEAQVGAAGDGVARAEQAQLAQAPEDGAGNAAFAVPRVGDGITSSATKRRICSRSRRNSSVMQQDRSGRAHSWSSLAMFQSNLATSSSMTAAAPPPREKGRASRKMRSISVPRM